MYSKDFEKIAQLIEHAHITDEKYRDLSFLIGLSISNPFEATELKRMLDEKFGRV